MSEETKTINSNPYDNNIYELMYIDLNGKINKVTKSVWLKPDKFDAIGSNVTQMSPNILVSKITQLNTGDFLFLGSNCNVYKMDQYFKNPVQVSAYPFTSLTQLSNYQILLTKKDGKMYVVNDVNNFDLTTKPFFDDGTTYCSVKQTVDGYVVAIDGTQCGTTWRFDLINNQLINKTKINLDDTFTNRVSLFLPDQLSLVNLNCNSRYKDRVYKYDYLDRTINSTYDFRCGDDEVYEKFNKKCYISCPQNYNTNESDIVSCWSKCNSSDIDVGALCRTKCGTGFHDIGGVCWNDKKLTYDVGVGLIPTYSCPDGYQLEGLKCIKNPPAGYKRTPGDYTTYWLDQPVSYNKSSKNSIRDTSACSGLDNPFAGFNTCTGWDKNIGCGGCGCIKQAASQDNSACGGLSNMVIGAGTCSGWDGCNSRSIRTCTRNYACCDYDWLRVRCNRQCNDTCSGGDCIGAAVTRDAPRTCPNGWRFDGTNCWEDVKCSGGFVTRNAPTVCPSGYSFDSGDPLHFGYCFENCKDGYVSRPGDIVSCWNKNPTSILIPPSNTINATPSCNSNKEYRDLMCYTKCDSGYIGAATNCSLPIDQQSYVPSTYAKKTISRGDPIEPGAPAPITCGNNCCMFDLAFYNPAYIKPSTLNLPPIPITTGLIGYYDSSSFVNGIWYDLTQSNNHITQIKGSFIINKTFITGTSTSSILFPTQMLPSTYTIFNISKYLTDSKLNGKILSGYNSNWFSGFTKGFSGVSGRNIPITQTTLSAFDDKWVFSTDTNTTYKANGTNYTLNNLDIKNEPVQLSINLNKDPLGNSNFSISCVIVFNRTLSLSEITQIETWLSNTYSNLWSQTYTKTFAQLGYTCFDNKIGKVTNDYTNYSIASYRNGPLECEWINLPKKNNFDALTCESTSKLNYEKFTSMNYSNDFLYYLLIIFFIVIIVLKINK